MERGPSVGRLVFDHHGPEIRHSTIAHAHHGIRPTTEGSALRFRERVRVRWVAAGRLMGPPRPIRMQTIGSQRMIGAMVSASNGRIADAIVDLRSRRGIHPSGSLPFGGRENLPRTTLESGRN